MPETTEEQVKEQPKTPQEFLAGFPNGPTPAQIREWKMEVPGNRIRMFSPPATEPRAYIVRPISGLELANIFETVPANSQNKDVEVQLRVVTKCLLWSSEKGMTPYTELELRSGPAGLVQSLFEVINALSDFYDPSQLSYLSVDL